MSRKRPKSLETNVYRKLWQLEHWAYTRVDAWKKSYRYSLINEFREHITFAKNAYIAGFELLGRFKDDKVNYFRASMGELSIVVFFAISMRTNCAEKYVEASESHPSELFSRWHQTTQRL